MDFQNILLIRKCELYIFLDSGAWLVVIERKSRVVALGSLRVLLAVIREYKIY
jgi:hypothetical protein